MSCAPGVTHRAPSCSDQELVAAVRGGDDAAFEELYSRYRGRIGAYILRMVGDHGRAEDIAQEVFISALRRLRATERPIAFKAWVYEIAKNACIDEFRRTRRRYEVPLDGQEEPRVLSAVTAPEAAVESKQRLDDLRGAFRGLSESHHQIIVLRELEGLTYNQIGARMGMSKPVVESTLFRARRRLSHEYDELVSGRRCQQVQATIGRHEEGVTDRLGIRERRQLARHLAHCQQCRRLARSAGLDDSLFETPTLIGRIAALLPIPWMRLRRASGNDKGINAGAHPLAAIQQLQSVAPYADPGASVLGFGRVAAAAAALVIGGGGGIVTLAGQGTSSPMRGAAGSAQKSSLLGPAAAVGGHAVTPRAGMFSASSSVLGWTVLGSGAAPIAQARLLGVAPVGSDPAITAVGLFPSQPLRITGSGQSSRRRVPLTGLPLQPQAPTGSSTKPPAALGDLSGGGGPAQTGVGSIGSGAVGSGVLGTRSSGKGSTSQGSTGPGSSSSGSAQGSSNTQTSPSSTSNGSGARKSPPPGFRAPAKLAATNNH